MQRSMRWAGAVAVVFVAAACGRRPDAAARFDVAAEFAKVTAAHTAFVAARDRLDRSASSTAGGNGTADVGDRIREARAAYDAAYANEQAVLAGFLNRALNLAPERPEARQALAMYADAAVAEARYLAGNAGDPRQALEPLAAADRAYKALGVPPPAALTAALAEASRPAAPTPTATVAPPPRTRRHHGRR